MVTSAQIVAEARTWLGTPWQHQQRMKGVAVDCAGLVIGVARALGLVETDFDVGGYMRQPDGSMLPLLCSYMDPVPSSAMAPGDVIAFAIAADPQHVGILGDYRHGGLSVIHAASRPGLVVETRLMFHRRMRFAAAFRFRGVTA